MTPGHIVRGAGTTPVLVLSGNASDHSHYAPAFPFLDGKTFSYAFLDYRGYGLSREQHGEHTLEELSSDALALVGHLGWDKFHVVGHSMGGMLAQLLAARHKTRITSMVAVTPVPACGVKVDLVTRKLLLDAAVSDDVCLGLIDGLIGGNLPASAKNWVLRRFRDTTTVEAFSDYIALSLDTDFSAELAGLKTPCLVIAGELDTLYPASLFQETLLRWLPRAELIVMPHCGHFPMLEAPLRFVALVETFLRRHI